MYGLPPDADLSFLVGAALLQVCIGENEVILNLDLDISIMVSSVVQVVSPDGAAEQHDQPAVIGVSILGLVGKTITDAHGDESGTTALRWENGQVIRILDSWKEYESYTIRHGETVLVV